MSLRIVKTIAGIRRAAPYLAIELILPGGSIVALILWLLRNRACLQRLPAKILLRAKGVAQSAAVLRPSTASTL